ncbi:translocation and assembly module TamB [Hyphomicrobium sp. 1Nfss2.1]|uniref:translocation/assembly module TamB domain-containing protein n=1 Tax=Hyphomicrobium sp. 1Nfss2.1 TaxID=3413936 RepID=UPI003C7C6820
MRRARKWLARSGLALLVVFLATTGLLATSAGQRLALSLASYVASDADSRLEIGSLEGSLFGDGRIDRIVLSDRNGSWLEMHALHISWQPAQLLVGRVAVDTIDIGTVRVLRQPVSSSASADSGDAGGGAPTLIPVTLGRAEVRELIIEEPVAGMTARLRVTASADLADPVRGLSAQLAVLRLDQPGARLQARFGYHPDSDVVDLVIDGQEPADGLIAHVLEVPDRPPMGVHFSGSGPRDRWRAEWALLASEQRFAAGTVSVDRVADGHKLTSHLEGYLARVVPATLAGVLDGKTVGTLRGVWSENDRFRLDEFTLSSAAIAVSASGAIDLARPYVHGRAAVQLARQDGAPVEFALGDAHVTLRSLAAKIVAPDAESRVVHAEVDAEGLGGSVGSVASLKLSARAEQTDAAGRMAFDAAKIEGSATAEGVLPPGGSDTPTTAALTLLGQAKSGVLTIAKLRAALAGAIVDASATVSGRRIAGSADLNVADLGSLASLAGRPLAGAVALRASGEAGFDGDDFALVIEGSSRDLKLGADAADRLLAGTARINGRLARVKGGDIQVDDLAFKADAADALVRARFSGSSLALAVRANVRDLAKVADALGGSAALQIDVSGAGDNLISKVSISGDDVRVNGAKLNAPRLTFSGRGPLDAHAGRLDIGGDVGGKPIDGGAAIAFAEASGLKIDDLKLTLASAQVGGSLHLPPNGAPNGRLVISVPRLGDLAPLAGVPMAGSAKADVELTDNGGVAVATLQAEAPALRIAEKKLQGLSARATLVDYMQALRITGQVRLASFDDAGIKLRDAQIDAVPAKDGTAIKASARVNDFAATVSAEAARKESTLTVSVASASLRKEGLSALIDQRATVTMANDAVKIDRLVIKTDKGRTEIAGTIAPDAMDLSIALKQLPAGLANAFDSTLGLEGHIDGTVKIGGSFKTPKADAAVAWTGASAAAMRAQSLPPLRVDARARLAGEDATGEVTVSGAGGLSAKAVGRAGIGAKGAIAVKVNGTIPLVLANGALGDRAASASGTAYVAADVTGALADPRVAGTIRIENAALNDPGGGLKLAAINGAANFTRNGLTIERLQGTSVRGGTFTSGGSVLIGQNGAITTDLELKLVGLKFDDQQLISGELDADLAVSGPLDALLARGNIGLKRLDVTVPSQLPGSITSLDIKHVNAPAGSYAARAASKAQEQRSAPAVNGRLDVRLDAANRIFVRGRGLDAQLGGALHVQGTTNAPRADGAFVMERGRLSILGRELDFKRGRIYFNGSVQPMLDMEAAADADGYTITVTISGPAAKPTFTFSSDPALPEDEVIARLLFNKSLAKLSAVQLAQLAGEIDKIGGLSSGPSTLDRLKSAAGIDVFDVSTDDANNPVVSAGSYVNESTYVGVKQGTSASSSRVVIDHDLTKTLKARGELGADGNSKIGVGVEWDY